MIDRSDVSRPAGRHRGRRLWLAALLAATLGGCITEGIDTAGQSQPGQVAAATDAHGGEPWLIPSTERGYLMHAGVFRPAGPGPFPLAVINHGSEQDPARRRRMAAVPRYEALTDWFLARGYLVVVPLRPGHGQGGRYLEDQGGCRDADYVKAANGTADSIGAVVAYMRAQPFVRGDGVVVAGHSAGAWGGLAYAARQPAGVASVIVFSGGRGGRNFDRAGNNCAPERLVESAGAFGARARLPTLWLYAENDSYFAPDLSQAMAAAFKAAGGRAEYHLFLPQGSEGHALIRGTAWGGVLGRFLDGEGRGAGEG